MLYFHYGVKLIYLLSARTSTNLDPSATVTPSVQKKLTLLIKRTQYELKLVK